MGRLRQILLQLLATFDFINRQRCLTGEVCRKSIRAASRDGMANAIVQGVLAKDIQVESIGMVWIQIGFSLLIRREISLHRLHLILANLHEGCLMLYPFLVLVIEMAHQEVSHQRKKSSAKPKVGIAIEGEIANQADRHRPEQQQFTCDESIVLTLQGSNLGCILFHRVLITFF